MELSQQIKREYIRFQIMKLKARKQRLLIAKLIREANAEGISFQKIAKDLGVTTQAVHSMSKEREDAI